MACTGLGNLGKTGQCTPGYYTGLIIFKSAKSISIDSANLEATWEALSDILPPDNLMYVRFDNAEFSENETIEEDLIGGRKIVVDEKFGMDKYDVVADLCAYNSIYKNNKNGLNVYGFYTTSGGFVMGKISADKNSIEAIQFYMSATTKKSTTEATGKVTLNVQPQEDWIGNSHAVAMDFDMFNLDVVKNAYLVDIAGTASTSITFDLYDCGRISNADADPDNFVITDASGSPVAVDTATQVGNSYTLNSTALSAGVNYVSYDPTVGSDYIYVPSTSVTVA